MKRIVTVLPGFSMGGAEHMAYELIRNLDPEKYESVVICYGPKKNTPLEDKAEAVCPVKYIGITGTITPLRCLKVLRAISGCKPDIVHAHMGGAGFAAVWSVLFSKPIVVTIHTAPEKAFGKKAEKIIRFAMKKNRSCLVAVSDENYSKACGYFDDPGFSIQCVNNGVDIHRFTRDSHDAFTFINVARQDENKNQAAILRAFAKIYESDQNTRLLLVGDGPCRARLEKMAREQGVEGAVTFTGMVADPAPYYRVSDVYVQSSHREAMPLSVLEAMAAGLPLISTDVGGIRDVVKENGILVPDHDAAALTEAMLRLMYESDESREKRSVSSKRIVCGYSSEEMAKQYIRIYERAAANGDR